MLNELHRQLEDFRGGSIDASSDYGHAISDLLTIGQCQQTEEDGIREMTTFAEKMIIKFGGEILNLLRSGLRELIQPENLEGLEQAHQEYIHTVKNHQGNHQLQLAEAHLKYLSSQDKK